MKSWFEVIKMTFICVVFAVSFSFHSIWLTFVVKKLG